MRKADRIARIEKRRKPPPKGKAHLIGVTTTEDEALDEYGRDKIGPDDFVILLVGARWPDGGPEEPAGAAPEPPPPP
jgi:hypothetical protein